MLPNNVHYVIYNGVQLNLTKIDDFDCATEYDESQTDRQYNRVSIRVVGYANGQINQNGLTNAALLTYLRQTLMEARRPLQVVINGVPTINVTDRDAKNGPIPRNVKVYSPLAGATIMVEFSIDYWESPCPGGDGLIVLSNRWSQKTDIDADGMTTLTSTGRLVIDASKTANIADAYRNISQPITTIPQGFTRESQSFNVTPDGTVLEWTIVDKEQFLPPPVYTGNSGEKQIITRWESSWREGSSMEQGGGAVVVGTLTVKAWGQKNVAKNILLLFCLRVFNSRWNRERDIIRRYEFEEGLNENSVSLTVELITFSTTDYTDTKFQTSTRIGTNLDIYQTGETTAAIPNRGSAGLWIAVKDIVATCSSKTTQTVVTSNTTNTIPTFSGGTPTNGAKTISTAANQVSQDNNPYTLSHIETEIVEDQSVIQLPVASEEASTPCFNAQMAAPLSKMIVRFDMQRLNASPKLPSSVLAGRTVLRKIMKPSDPLILPSGVDRIYRIRGEYWLGYDQTAQIGTLPFVMPAAITDSRGIGDQNSIGPSSFTTALLG